MSLRPCTLWRLFFTMLLLSGPFAVQADGKPAPFTTDGCSAFPDGTLSEQTLWLKCCTAHDRAYWRGGSYRQRLAADRALLRCVQRTGEPGIATMMLVGVRIGGTPFLPTRFRWGYAWPFLRGYRSLSQDEKKLLEATEP